MQRFSYAKVPRNPGTAGRDFSVLEKDEHSAPKEVKVEALPVPTAAPDLAGDILKDPTLSRDQSSGSNLHVEKLSAFAKPQNEVGSYETRKSHRISSRKPKRPHVLRAQSPVDASNGNLRSALQRERMEKARLNAREYDRSPTELGRAGNDGEGSDWEYSSSDQEEHQGFGFRSSGLRTNRQSTTQDGARSFSYDEHGFEPSSRESSPHKSNEAHDLLNRIKNLEHENRRLRDGEPSAAPPPVPHYTWRTLHAIRHDIFLEPPQWLEGELGPTLYANLPLQNVEHYLEQHPEIAFLFYKDYHAQPPTDLAQILSKDGVFKPAEPFSESLLLISEHIVSAVEILAERLPEFFDLFPDIDFEKEIRAPYLFAYYSIPLLASVQLHLSPLQNDLIMKLTDSILANYGDEYIEAKRLTSRGVITKKLMKYLIQPGDVLVKNDALIPRAYIATTWAAEQDDRPDALSIEFRESRNHKKAKSKTSSSSSPEQRKYSWHIEVWSWEFDGCFRKVEQVVKLQLKVSGDSIEVDINNLNFFPIKYGSRELKTTLEERGKTFWKCRIKNFVSYTEDDGGVLSSIGERYIIDTKTFKAMHQDSPLAMNAISPTAADIDVEQMANDSPPEGDSIFLFPPFLKGYELRGKRWVDLFVDRISDVSWNKKAFESLVVNERTKELVQALITNQLTAEKSTDMIGGKGNGLTILLHGGPGTGKTFTAEGVAEMAEKPLLRVTCGDVGTQPAQVEKYLEAVFELGKVWDCVVLLDEADVFLEERRLTDLERNALVSVFLRVIEYNVGILILTSNRVGTFDEAFKSRIQLALHYKNLTSSQQKKIWRNFLSRLKNLDQDSVDFDDIVDHIDELGKEDMNGRQIRNVITTARQLAQYKGKKFCYEHLRHAIDVSSEFEQYLQTLNQGFSDDQIMLGEGLR